MTISQERAIEIAKSHFGDISEAVISAKFKEAHEIDFNNVKQLYRVWIVEARYPPGNREAYYLEASTGKILMMSEQEAPMRRDFTIGPLQVGLERDGGGFRFLLAAENANQTIEVQAVVSPEAEDGSQRVIHLVRSTTGTPEGQQYRVDLVIVNPMDQSAIVTPLPDLRLPDLYSVDTLTRIHGFSDPTHAILLQPLQPDGPDGSLRYDLVSLDIITGRLEKLIEGALPDMGSDFLAKGWVHAKSKRMFVNTFSGGTMWTLDWGKSTAWKWPGTYKNTWPLVRLFRSPDGERFWFANHEGSGLYGIEGDSLLILPFEPGMRTHPPYQWSPDSRYAVTEFRKDENHQYVLRGEEGIYDIATSGIRIYDRQGQVVWEFQVEPNQADQPETFIEWSGWLADGGQGVLRRYELERVEGSIPRKVKATYSLLDVTTGEETKLQSAARLEDLRHPLAINESDEEGRLLIVDRDLSMYAFVTPVGGNVYLDLLSDPGADPIIWKEANYGKNQTAVHRYEPATGATTTISWNEARGMQLQLVGDDLVFDTELHYRYIR